MIDIQVENTVFILSFYHTKNLLLEAFLFIPYLVCRLWKALRYEEPLLLTLITDKQKRGYIIDVR